MSQPSPDNLEVAFEPSFEPPAELPLAPDLTANYALFERYNTAATELRWAVARQSGRVVAAAPITRLRRRPATDMLRPEWRQRLGWLGPLARKTSLIVDTAFLAFDEHSPFQIAEGVDRHAAKQAIARFLCRQKKIDTVWIAEPPAEAAWAVGERFDQFQILPMTSIDLAGCASFDDFLASLSKKRRRNYRHESGVFAEAGATIATVEGPLAAQPQLLQQLVTLLQASEAHSDLIAPYNDVLIAPEAFAEQQQTALVAAVDDRVVGFMSFVHVGDRWMQVHGGLDYDRSHDVLAYHNLIYAGVQAAIERGCRVMTMGPLNNETKRRAATDLHPIVASVWNRWPADRWLARAWFFKNFGVYYGPIEAPGAGAAAD